MNYFLGLFIGLCLVFTTSAFTASTIPPQAMSYRQNSVICSVMMQTKRGVWKRYDLHGWEFENKARIGVIRSGGRTIPVDKIYVDFTANWPKEIPTNSTVIYVPENDCLYLNPKTYDGN